MKNETSELKWRLEPNFDNDRIPDDQLMYEIGKTIDGQWVTLDRVQGIDNVESRVAELLKGRVVNPPEETSHIGKIVQHLKDHPWDGKTYDPKLSELIRQLPAACAG